MEQDEALLAAAEKADAGGAAGAATKASTAGGIAVGGTAVLSAAERYALYYRLGQKRLTRDYLLYARYAGWARYICETGAKMNTRERGNGPAAAPARPPPCLPGRGLLP